MKKLSTLLFLCLTTLGLVACGVEADAAPGSGSAVAAHTAGSAEEQTQPDGSGSAANEEDPNTRSFRDCTVVLTGYSLREDAEGNTALRVEYEFSNRSQSPASFSTTVLPSAYQIPADSSREETEALEYATPAEADTEYSAMLTRIESGETISCAVYYKLTSAELPVTLIVQDLRDSTAEELTRTLDITGLSIETEPLEPASSDTQSSADSAA